MAKNILIFSDGTGQGASLPENRRSNVRKLCIASIEDAEQTSFYDDGLGSGDTWSRWAYNLVSKATGLGISQNIKDCYGALIERYEPGDRIFLFGFSRGAYTVRSLGGVLSLCGIPTRDARGRDPKKSHSARDALAEQAVEKIYKVYGDDTATKEKRKELGRIFRRDFASHDAPPYFVGVWDTVRALGIPGSNGVVLWRHAFHDHTLHPAVPYARHALSIDENRAVFEAVLWETTPEDISSGRIRQVWFPGVHCNVGGGYAESELSDLALQWMIDEATSIPHPLRLDPAKLTLKPSALGIQHDERNGGLKKLWRAGLRPVPADADLFEDHTATRFKAEKVPTLHGERPYRPEALRTHATYRDRYGS